MSALPKPILRGHIKRRGIRGIIGALSFAAFNGSMFYFFVAKPKQEAFDEFLRTYDAEAHFKEIDKYGYLTFRKIFKEEVNKSL